MFFDRKYDKKPPIDPERLKEKRLEKGWNKLEASQNMDMPQSVYLRYESGERNPTYSALRNMALTLGTSAEYLTGQSDDDRPHEFIVSSDDEKLIYIIDTYKNAPDESRERLYKYAMKMSNRK